MKFEYEVKKWKLSELLDKLNENKFVKLPHQRPLTLKKNATKTFVESALNHDLLETFIIADLESCLKCSTTQSDIEFFKKYLDKGYTYSIEDCQHRMASLQSVDDSLFVGEFSNMKDQFYNTEVHVGVLKYATRSDLIRKFGKVNSGKTVTNDNLLWGIENTFNSFIKDKFISGDEFLKLYKTKKRSESVERTIYGNILKIFKVCSYYEGFVNSSNTSSSSIKSFVTDNLNPVLFDNILNLFDRWYEIIKEHPQKESFTAQSNLFFILHVNHIKNKNLNDESIKNILSLLTDTRLMAEKRYEEVLKLI